MFWKRFWEKADGQELVEYALPPGLGAVAAAAGHPAT